MRVLVCGSRNWDDQEYLDKYLDGLKEDIEIVIEGEAPGADTMAREWAEKNNIPVEKYPAQWEKYKKLGKRRAAGPIRNKQMLDEGKPDLVIAFSKDFENSRGTKNMVTQAKKANVMTVLAFEEDNGS